MTLGGMWRCRPRPGKLSHASCEARGEACQPNLMPSPSVNLVACLGVFLAMYCHSRARCSRQRKKRLGVGSLCLDVTLGTGKPQAEKVSHPCPFLQTSVCQMGSNDTKGGQGVDYSKGLGFLSKSTSEGVRVTIHSIKHLLKYLAKKPCFRYPDDFEIERGPSAAMFSRCETSEWGK